MSGNVGISLVRQWFQNAIEDKINESILFIETNDAILFHRINMCEEMYSEASFNILTIDAAKNPEKFSHYLPIRRQQNTIILKVGFINSIDGKEQYKNILRQLGDKKILYAQIASNISFYNLAKFLNNDETRLNGILCISEVLQMNLLQLINDLRELKTSDFHFALKYAKDIFPTTNDLYWLQEDIKILQNFNVLTSRLAVVLYRFVFLNANANHTLIGRYIHKICGVRSKTMNSKYSALKNHLLPDDLKYKNFKAYDLSINESDIAIREEIAAKLLNLQIQQLGIETVAKVTSLTIERIEKLRKKM